MITSHNHDLNKVTAGVDCTAIDFVSQFPWLLWPDIWFLDCYFHQHKNFSHSNSPAYSANYYWKFVDVFFYQFTEIWSFIITWWSSYRKYAQKDAKASTLFYTSKLQVILIKNINKDLKFNRTVRARAKLNHLHTIRLPSTIHNIHYIRPDIQY